MWFHLIDLNVYCFDAAFPLCHAEYAFMDSAVAEHHIGTSEPFDLLAELHQIAFQCWEE